VSEQRADELDALGQVPSATPPPPPSPALLEAMGAIRPVRTRVPLRTLLLLAAAAAVYPIAAIAVVPLRRDLHALPPLWLGAVALVWLAGFIVPLALAILPRRGQVLPDGARAGRAAMLAALTLVLMGLLFTVDAPGLTLVPATSWAGFLRPWWHCVSFGLRVSVPTVIIGALFFRRLMAASLARAGAAIGAAAGALAGLTLHGICPYGGGLHVGLAHGGGVVVGALLGALWLPLLVRATAPKSR
jgi:hypothetical protein